MTLAMSLLSVLLVVLCPSVASSEWYGDLYGGVVFDGKVDMDQQSSVPPGVTTSEVKTEPGATAGVRGGYWFETLPFGIGLDLFFMRVDTNDQSVPGTFNGTPVDVQVRSSQTTAWAIAFDLLRMRFPLFVSERFPHGQVQPYLSAGPTLFFSRFKDTGGTVTPANQSSSDTVLGVKIGAGVTVQISRLVGIFAEYRFTHFQADATLSNATPASAQTLERIVDSHHLIGGVSFAF